jgi:hypothetical protein
LMLRWVLKASRSRHPWLVASDRRCPRRASFVWAPKRTGAAANLKIRPFCWRRPSGALKRRQAIRRTFERATSTAAVGGRRQSRPGVRKSRSARFPELKNAGKSGEPIWRPLVDAPRLEPPPERLAVRLSHELRARISAWGKQQNDILSRSEAIRRLLEYALRCEEKTSNGKKNKGLSGPQIRAARALLKWSAADLARRASLGVNTIGRAELADYVTSLTTANELAIRRALENAGVEFIDENGGGPGVRLRKPPSKKG